jgi:hypothetical protein
MFISYASKDKEKIAPFLNMLRAIHGLSYYFYEETKEIAKETKKDILDNIHKSNTFLVFHSQNSLQSSYVQHEIGVAVGLNKQVIIANLDGSRPDGMLQGVNYLDFSNENIFKQEIDKLINWVKSKITPKQSTANVSNKTTEEFDWVSFLLIAGILAGSFYLLYRS